MKVNLCVKLSKAPLKCIKWGDENLSQWSGIKINWKKMINAIRWLATLQKQSIN